MRRPSVLVPIALAAAVALAFAATGSVAIGALLGLASLIGLAVVLADARAGASVPHAGRRRTLGLLAGAGAMGVVGGSLTGAALRRALRPDPIPALEADAIGLGADNLDLVLRQFRPGRSGDLQLVLAPWNSSNYAPESLSLVRDDPRTSHAAVWMYLQRIPIVVWGPGAVAPRDGLERVTLADLAPTTAHLMGFDGLDAVDGRVLPGIDRPARPPKVIVTLVVDGGGWNVLQHWDGEGDESAWPELKRLMRDGATYRDAIMGSFPAVTACAHATIGTGAFPRSHGITGHNVRWQGRPRKAFGEAGHADPTFMLLPTLADRWSMATGGAAWIGELGYQIWHLGMIGAGGIPADGAPPVAVLWDEAGGGGWIPQHPERYRMPRSWPGIDRFERLLADYDDPGIDDRFTLAGSKSVCCTPPIIEYQADLIEATFDAEPIGRGDATSLLYINVKAPDYAGHVYNYLSERERIALAETDRLIGRVARLLERRFAPGDYVMIVTADHGQSPTVNLAGGVRLDPIQLESHLSRRFGPSIIGVVESVVPSEVYLDRRALAEIGVGEEEIAAELSTYTYGDNLGPYVPEAAIDRDRLDQRIFSAVLPGRYLSRLRRGDLARFGPGVHGGDPLGVPPVTW